MSTALCFLFVRSLRWLRFLFFPLRFLRPIGEHTIDKALESLLVGDFVHASAVSALYVMRTPSVLSTNELMRSIV